MLRAPDEAYKPMKIDRKQTKIYFLLLITLVFRWVKALDMLLDKLRVAGLDFTTVFAIVGFIIAITIIFTIVVSMLFMLRVVDPS